MALARDTFIVMVILFGLISFTSAQEPIDNDVSWLLFTAAHEAGWNIYRMRFDGSELQNLTPHSDNSGILALSPDQQWIYFSERNILYRMRVDSSERQQLLVGDSLMTFHTISLDGEWLFVTRYLGPDQIYRISSDGSEANRINFPYPEFPIYDRGWSPDGQWLFFLSEYPDPPAIYRMSATSNMIENITENYPEGDPTYYTFIPGARSSYSPDGEWLLFVCSGEQRVLSICRMRYDGSAVQELTPFNMESSLVGWSLDGKWIYFFSQAGEAEADLYRMRLDGSHVQQLTNFSTRTDFLTFTPDGKQMLLWVGEARTPRDLYRMNLDSSEPELLFSTNLFQRLETWSPDTKWMIFFHEGFYRASVDGSIFESMTDNPGEYWYVGWSSDGEWLLYVYGKNPPPYTGILSGHLYRVNINTLEIQKLTSEPLTYSFNSFYLLEEQ